MYDRINDYMKILLISPNIKGIAGGINRIQPPLGLAYLASYLRDKYEVVVYDTAIEGWDNFNSLDKRTISIGESSENIEKAIRAISPDVVGISIVFSSMMDSAKEIASLCKQVNSKTIVVCGGSHITNLVRDWTIGFRYEPLNDSNVDYYFWGEGELPFVEFIERINKGKKQATSGMCFFQNGDLIVSSKPPLLNLTNCLDPSWDLFSMEKYFSVGLFHSAQSYSTRVLPVMASRGCPEKCQFCTTPFTMGSSVRWKDPEKLSQEIQKFAHQYAVGEIQFQDDTLTAHLSNLYKLCDRLKDLRLPWCTPNGIKVNYHSQDQSEMFRRMKESGCYQVTLACESGTQRVLNDVVKKNTKVSQFKPAIQKAKDAGLFVHTFWIVGFPDETFDEMKQTIEVASQSGADSFSVSILSPFPGTFFYHKAIRENLWWDPLNTSLQGSLLRNSLIEVDGFNSPEVFEAWVESQNVFLNGILETKDGERYRRLISGRGRGVINRKIKQT